MTEPVHRFDIEPTFAPAPWIDNVPDAPLSRDDKLFEELVATVCAMERARRRPYSDHFLYEKGKAEGILMAFDGPKTLTDALATNWRDLADRAMKEMS